MLMMARLDTEEQVAKAKKNRRRGGVIHNKANSLDQTKWETGSMNSQSSFNSFASTIKSASTHKTGSTTVTTKKYTDEEEVSGSKL